MDRAEKGGTAKKDRLSAIRLIDGEFCHELGREVSSIKWAFP
jgi:hypothetical protein